MVTVNSQSMSATQLMHLIYISSATSWPSEVDLTSLLEQARARNLRQNITGILVYSNATYTQVLEGDSHDVYEIFDAIRVDPRNNGVVTLLAAGIPQRNFPDWSMGFKELEKNSGAPPPGFVEVFNGKLDKVLALGNSAASVGMLMSFARG